MNAPHQPGQHAMDDAPATGDEQLTVAEWSSANQNWLAAQFNRLSATLEALAWAAASAADAGAPAADDDNADGAEARLTDDAPATMRPALLHLAEVFGLSLFERELLLLSAGCELDPRLRHSVRLAQAALADPRPGSGVTFGLALLALPSPHWDAISPESPLRRWRLIQLHGAALLPEAPLRIDERVLHYVCGVPATDERLDGLVHYLGSSKGSTGSGPRARRIAGWLAQQGTRMPLVVIEGDARGVADTRDEALAALGECGRHALWIAAHDLPDEARALAGVAAALEREAMLTPAWPVIASDAVDDDGGALERRVAGLLAHMATPAVVTGRLGLAACASLPQRQPYRMPAAGAADAREFAACLPDPALRAALTVALQQFDLGRSALQAALEQITLSAGTQPDLAERVWQACREQARGGLDAHAQRVAGAVGFDDLVLPAPHLRILREIADHLGQRDRVYRQWGMGGKSERGRGLCALFTGESGTGKTLAAEAIATEARLDLYRVDLATVVSKYIGETEKNLKRLFEAAHASGAVLLFDEADALFGKRSEVKDSHDRYANVEIAYLLQSIEAYRGLALLTTNFKSAIDPAFLRRIRFVLPFPFPDAAARERIWRQQFPEAAPVGDIDFAALARAALPGGNIRNVALNAAFRAAAGAGHITHAIVAAALREEFAKLERSPGNMHLGDGT